jgi:hypothetical protein
MEHECSSNNELRPQDGAHLDGPHRLPGIVDDDEGRQPLVADGLAAAFLQVGSPVTTRAAARKHAVLHRQPE